MRKLGMYVGPLPELQGKSALLQVEDDCIFAQFDDIETGMGFGWWLFKKSDFEVIEKWTTHMSSLESSL